MNKVLFVCRANVCRSPMAEAIFNALAEDAGLDLRAESAGVAALEGGAMDVKARTALEELGIYPGAHRARQVTRALVEEADLVLTMSLRQHATLLDGYGASPSRTHTLPAHSDNTRDREEIADPHGQSLQAYRASSRSILSYVDGIVSRAVTDVKR